MLTICLSLCFLNKSFFVLIFNLLPCNFIDCAKYFKLWKCRIEAPNKRSIAPVAISWENSETLCQPYPSMINSIISSVTTKTGILCPSSDNGCRTLDFSMVMQSPQKNMLNKFLITQVSRNHSLDFIKIPHATSYTSVIKPRARVSTWTNLLH